MRAEVFGPESHLDSHRFPRLHLLIERLRPPWDIVVAFGIIGCLFAMAILGALVVIWGSASLPSLIVGIALVGTAAGLGSHLASRWGI